MTAVLLFISFLHSTFYSFVYRQGQNNNKCLYRLLSFFSELRSLSFPIWGLIQTLFRTLRYSFVVHTVSYSQLLFPNLIPYILIHSCKFSLVQEVKVYGPTSFLSNGSFNHQPPNYWDIQQEDISSDQWIHPAI